MPYKSERQRRHMHAKLPKIAARWDREYGSSTAAPAPARQAPTAGKVRRKRR